ncbi:NADH:ubiquinone oxidoreductase [Macleaya cordata]|uniref:NADH:ubiquinone oxidoreductase n=1 Tax=Macleaya cordata TaxID=56857 RepID=A0A200QBL3_MACCD|nr:NADH:ubiquinone oxidoreductase [Macleaya cordata]
MSLPKSIATGAGMLRNRIKSSLRTRGGGGDGPSRWSSPGHQERPNGYLFNQTPLAPGESRKWEDWELPYYITGFLTVVILGVGLNAKPDLTIETWAHQKALERLENQKIPLGATADDSD